MEKTLKLEPMMWMNDRRELEKRNEKATIYSLKREAEKECQKRKMVMEIIGGALIGAPLLYAAMLSVCIIF